MPPDQYAQWQQWQQYQQQYAQWHAQYGEQYARQMGQPMPAVAQPAPPMPMPTAAPVAGPSAYVAPPPTMAAAPPPPAEPHPDTVAATRRARTYDDEQSQKTAEELAFDEQFRKWEEEFENWKSKNANHPDKAAYHEYEKKFIECRKKLLERREHLRNKRLAERAAAKGNQPPPPPPPADSGAGGQGMGLFANALGGSFGFGGGIPGLDLLNETRSDVGRKQPPAPAQVTEIIELDDDNDNDIKPDINKVNERMAAANPVTALASLLKDPKVSALLNIITNTTQSAAATSLPAGQSDILQKLHSAAGAVVNANGGLPSSLQPPTRPPLQDDRSRTSFGDDRSRDYDSFNQAAHPSYQPQPMPQNLNFSGIPGVASAPPPTYANNGYNYGGMPPAAAAPPPTNYAAGAPPAAPAVPLMSLDLSRPPPLQGSPAPSNASSTNSQNRSSRWGQDKPPQQQQQQQQPPFNGGEKQQQQKASRWGVKERPQQQQQQKNNGPPQNGGKPAAAVPKPLLDEKKLPTYYSGHLNELQVDPELGTPCAVPKPEWMTEDEYDEIFDRYENVEVFEERKYKMELAIRVLEQQKRKQGLLLNGGQVAAKRGNPFAQDDDFFRPKQVIDYSNGAPQVIDYGHSSGGQPANSGKPDQRPGQGAPPRRLDYSHSQLAQGPNLPFVVDRPPHYSEASTAKLAMMHYNPNPQESNPNYPCKFILMNDNRPNRPSTKRGKRASSIRKQKLREQQLGGKPQQGPNQPPAQPNPNATDTNQKENNPAAKPPPAARPQFRQIVPLDALLLPNMGDMSPLDENEPPPFDLPPPPVAMEDNPAPPPQFDHHPAAMQDEPMSDYELEMKRGEPVDGPSAVAQCPIVPIEDLLMKPGRFQRPAKLCFVMRGLPGSGKSYLARMIKDCEVKQGGQAPRVLSLDDYFLVDTEVREPDPKTGRPVLVTKSEYKFDGDMEDIYMQNLVKAFKRTITEDVFHFIIVDCPNEHLKYYNEFYAVARSSGFKVFTVTLQTEIDLCIEQNIHKRTADEIRSYANNWTLGPDDHPLINASILFDDHSQHPAMAPADMDLCTEDDDGFQNDAVGGGEKKDGENGGESVPASAVTAAAVAKEGEVEAAAEKADENANPDVDEDSNVDVPELGMFTSKWDTDATEQNLARLDGISKPPRRPPTIEDFLQSDDQLDQFQSDQPEQPGKKRVRWADIEEAKAQRRMRDLGFVVGVTDWNRMMDPTAGGSALTKTKYIERVGRNNFRRN